MKTLLMLLSIMLINFIGVYIFKIDFQSQSYLLGTIAAMVATMIGIIIK